MSVFYPDIIIRRVSGISAEMLGKAGIKALILDVDNTLTTHNNPVPDEDVLLWLDKMRQAGIKMVIASNNTRERVLPFAKTLKLDYTARAMKPLTSGFSRAARRMGLLPREIAVVGDQIFTDILGGNLFGAMTILVEPIQPEKELLFRVKRRLEIPILKGCRRKMEKLERASYDE